MLVEVTETAALGDVVRARAFAGRLRELGCTLALDDFGSGYGSFAYLRELPSDVLKIDGQFVRGLVTSPADQAVVRALVDISRALGTTTVAEFVEDTATLELLAEIGVDLAQGHVIGHPVPTDASWSVRRQPAVGSCSPARAASAAAMTY